MSFKFIDLFAGIGGFHQAMKSIGGECVFASEIDPDCAIVYQKNYGIDPLCDITKVDEITIPKHDVLCAGFPCQAFSKAGQQKGFYDTRGTLFFDIERILKYHKSKYIILENVRNLVSHDSGKTFSVITQNLKSLGYRLTESPLIISPHQLGTPQLRERIYILGKYDPENVDIPLQVELEDAKGKDDLSIYNIVKTAKSSEEYRISEYEEKVLTAWDEFYSGINLKVIGFPIWSDEFNQDYALDNLPLWKQQFIQKNRNLYLSNKDFIDKWLEKNEQLVHFSPTHRKFEWQAGTSITSIWDGLIQFRPSGIRVKRPTSFPALVAIVQIPVIGKYKRRMTVKEVAKLQDFPSNFKPDKNQQKAYKQFGNSVNVNVVKFLADKLLIQ